MPDKNEICSGCVWWETFSCDGDRPFPCNRHKGIHDQDYEKLLWAYQSDIDAVCEPVHEQWKKYIFEDYYKE